MTARVLVLSVDEDDAIAFILRRRSTPVPAGRTPAERITR